MNRNLENKKYNEKLLEITELFMEESDDKALEKLYNLTNDKLVKKVIEWKKDYFEELSDVFTIPFAMYNDVIEYLFEKYKLNEISDEKELNANEIDISNNNEYENIDDKGTPNYDY